MRYSYINMCTPLKSDIHAIAAEREREEEKTTIETVGPDLMVLEWRSSRV